jgi:hypothetical protein
MYTIFKIIASVGVLYVCLGLTGLVVTNVGTYAIIRKIESLDYLACEADIIYKDVGTGDVNTAKVLVDCPVDTHYNTLLPITYSVLFPKHVYVGFPVIHVQHALLVFKLGIAAILASVPFLVYTYSKKKDEYLSDKMDKEIRV